jgi:hypothetical protein
MTAPYTVYAFVVITRKTHQDVVTKQGFGYSTPLKSPTGSIRYEWRLPFDEKKNFGASNSKQTIEDAAQNLSDNYMTGFGNRLPRDKYSMVLNFAIPGFASEEKKDGEILRALTTKEQDLFLDAFQAENRMLSARMKDTAYPRRKTKTLPAFIT